MLPRMSPVYITLHGNPLLWTPIPLVTSFIHQTLMEHLPGAPGWDSEYRLPAPSEHPGSWSPHLWEQGTHQRGHTLTVCVNLLIWLTGIRVNKTFGLPASRAGSQSADKDWLALRITRSVCAGEGRRNVQPPGNGGENQGLGVLPLVGDRILGQHEWEEVAGWCETCAWMTWRRGRVREGPRETAGLAKFPEGRWSQTCLQPQG